jgi:hypothetical protein
MAFIDAAADLLTDNAALIVAVCAFFVAVYQAYATRRHNRLSVTPHLVVFTDRRNDNGQAKFVVKLRNSGLGPAIIRTYEVLLDNAVFPIGDGGVVANTIASIVGRPTPHVAYHRLGVGDAIAKDQELILFSVGFSCSSHHDYQSVMKCFERLSARLVYASIYGKKFVYDSRTAGT